MRRRGGQGSGGDREGVEGGVCRRGRGACDEGLRRGGKEGRVGECRASAACVDPEAGEPRVSGGRPFNTSSAVLLLAAVRDRKERRPKILCGLCVGISTRGAAAAEMFYRDLVLILCK